MSPSVIHSAVPDAHPDFVRLMARADDPPVAQRPLFFRALPKLHRFFLQKRDAVARKDADAFAAAVRGEVDWLQRLEFVSRA